MTIEEGIDTTIIEIFEIEFMAKVCVISMDNNPNNKRYPQKKGKVNSENGINEKKDDTNYYKITKTNKALKMTGKNIIDSMSEMDYKHLGSKSGTLHFIDLLGLGSKKTTRTVKENGKRVYNSGQYGSSKPIGVTLVSDEDIIVPEIDMKTVKELMRVKKPDEPEILFDINSDIKYNSVKAGEEFHLSLYEFMFLVLRPEYAGLFEANGDPLGAELRAKSTNAVIIKEDGIADLISEVDEGGNKKFKLPTPTIQFYKGSPKSTMIDIDEKGPDGWVVKQEYERFADLVSKTGTVKGDKKESNRARKAAKNEKAKKAVLSNKEIESKSPGVLYPEPLLVALALQEALVSNQPSSAKSESELLIKGQNIIGSMDEKHRSLLGSKSGGVHCVNELRYKVHSDFESLIPKRGRLVGLTLVSDEEIQVPRIPVTIDYFDKEYENSFAPTNIDNRIVKAGEQFDVTLYEFMFLIIRDEYVGYCESSGDPKGVYFSPKLKHYLEGKSKFPTPNVKSEQPLNQVEISEKKDGVVAIKPEYLAKFGELLI
ncbi:hypothetical protein [Bacillus sp. FJAT-45350]|uniref:hypothetical protein n=1 Tax=Bacillus sp. FJAT-45350 TaxID=2011014 RepID=UPI000BB7BEB2|nr:hypothetical protein [Bacillus sp. FJAT-45350]